MLDSSLLSAIYPGLNFMLWVAFSENIFAISDIVLPLIRILLGIMVQEDLRWGSK